MELEWIIAGEINDSLSKRNSDKIVNQNKSGDIEYRRNNMREQNKNFEKDEARVQVEPQI